MWVGQLLAERAEGRAERAERAEGLPSGHGAVGHVARRGENAVSRPKS